ncbi:MAG TPA: lysylphosphatidylglycerol synthase transmembrane domain-containing protein [Aquabacterium sp.]|uniref:lysylphosphatidylglycerol synthase transmembrane domain-containing protein n=1 Tax=Aquabacterium sp. TaxID=1872578 RepID=UPI002E382071|nr:lysylphosphatidylglycerol synthase transmembrane domain-containing protein [Aquabacterium sp.]HEX5356129.1 lysylphosphatidylglycerol synthase transmembrane domain-containing protein [Aquabacterium sp.]
MVQNALDPVVAVTVPLWRRALTYGLLLAFAAWCVVGFRRDIAQIDLAPLEAGWMALVAATALSLWNYALRVVRWRLYLNRLGHKLPWRFVALTFMSGFAFTLSPGKLGEMVRGRYYQPKGITMTQVTGAFFVERLLDLLAMIILAAAVLAELQAYQSFLWLAMGLVAGLLAAVALVPWPKVAQQLDLRPHGKLVKAIQTVAHMLANARQFLSPGMLLMGLALGLMAWGAEAVGLKLLADAIAPDRISLLAAMGAYSIAIIVGALSFLPGGLGSTETVMTALLVAHGYSVSQAILLTLVCRLLTLWLAVLIGWICVWLLRDPGNL